MKKEEIRHDPIRDNIVKGIEYVGDNKSFVIKAFSIFIILVLATSYYKYSINIKSENSSHLSGRAQNTLINGNLDEAMVKFERVMNDYPNTPGATQSLIFILGEALKNNDTELILELLSAELKTFDDPIVLSALSNIKADAKLNNGETNDAIENYKKAFSYSAGSFDKYRLNLALAYIAIENYNDAQQILNNILNNETLDFSSKNNAEELLAFVTQKLKL